MCVDGAAGMMRGRVFVRMGVDERSAQGRSLNGQCKRDGDYLPHDVPIVRDPAHGVKEKSRPLTNL